MFAVRPHSSFCRPPLPNRPTSVGELNFECPSRTPRTQTLSGAATSDASATGSERCLLASRGILYAWVRAKCAALKRKAKSRVASLEVARDFVSAAVSTAALRMVVRLFRQSLLLSSVESVCGELQSLVPFRTRADVLGTVATTKLRVEFRTNSTRRSRIRIFFVSIFAKMRKMYSSLQLYFRNQTRHSDAPTL